MGRHGLPMEEAAEVLCQVGRGRITPRAILLQALHHDRFQIARDVPVVLARALGVRGLDLQHQFRRGHVVGAVEQRPQREQFPERGAQAVDIGATIHASGRQDLLRTGVAERADELPRPRHASLRLVGQLRQAQIHQHRMAPVGREHDVARLDVAVYAAGFVQGVGRLGDLPHNLHHLRHVITAAHGQRRSVRRDGSGGCRDRSGLVGLAAAERRFLGAGLVAGRRQRPLPTVRVDFHGAGVGQLLQDAGELGPFDQLHRVEPLIALRARGEHLDHVGVLDAA